MTPTAMFPSTFVRHDSPLGPLGIYARSGRLIRVDVARDGVLPGEGLDEMPTALHDEARRQFDQYFAGQRLAFDLPLLQLGTPFQNDVWHAISDVPCGETTTYGALAAELGRPTGARAVGGAVAACRLAILIPCHRVVGADGRVKGYSVGEGVETKKWLLRHESALVAIG